MSKIKRRKSRLKFIFFCDVFSLNSHFYCLFSDFQKGETEEEVLGYLRSAAGKARLLATQKFKQFEGILYHFIHYNRSELCMMINCFLVF